MDLNAQSTYSFSVAENAAVNAVVGRVSATDPDANDTLTFSITAGNAAGKFAVGTGTTSTPITVAAALDYETTKAYTLTLRASDGKVGVATTSVSISVTDVVDTLPPAPSQPDRIGVGQRGDADLEGAKRPFGDRLPDNPGD